LADELFPFAKKFYSDLEIRLNDKFFHQVPIFRPFRSIEEQNTYLAQTADPGIAQYVSSQPLDVDPNEYVHAEYGGLEVVQSGWVDLPLFLNKSWEYFLKQGLFREAQFDSNDLVVDEKYVEWKGLKFGKIVFCQGFMALENDFFNWLPFTPVKGQILEVAAEKPLPPYIINQGIFMLPVASHILKVGATYSWDPLDWEPTTEAANELLGKFQALFRSPYSVRSALAGIRPSVRDRRPLIGIHPEHDNVTIFNGLGTKGVTLGPYFANEFAQHLENGKELNSLVNIKRYFSLYFR
jgi:glycine/D-amino acid oxidase-like deaminating enzyme